jgi:flagellar biogenesis protein FliO
MSHAVMFADLSVLSMAFRLVVSLGIVLAMIAALAWAAKRPKGLGLGFNAKGAAITVRGREQLGRASTIALLQVGDRTILVGANEHTISVLAEGDELLPPEAPVPADDRTSSIAEPDGSVSSGMNLIEMIREWSVRRT